MSTFLAISIHQFVGDYSDLPPVSKVFNTTAEEYFKQCFRNEALGDPRRKSLQCGRHPNRLPDSSDNSANPTPVRGGSLYTKERD